MFKPTIALLAVLGALNSMPASGFEINPANHDGAVVKRSLKSEYQRFLSRLSSPTHERLTELALACAESSAQFDWCDLPATDLSGAKKFDLEVLKFGVRWNDDPNNFFRVNQEFTWFFWLKAASATPRLISPTYPLEYRSHYGDMQFLHGMARSGEAPEKVRDNVVEWIHFAYDVATGRIDPSAQLHALEDTYPFAKYLDGSRRRNWTVRHLFTNVSDIWCTANCNALPADDEQIRTLALGAILHTVQDSFSHAHVERTNEKVHAWLDYAAQDPDCHRGADEDTLWIDASDIHAKPAIAWSAWFVRSAMLNVPWDQGVRDELFKRTFVLDSEAATPNSGGYETNGANCHPGPLSANR